MVTRRQFPFLVPLSTDPGTGVFAEFVAPGLSRVNPPVSVQAMPF